MTAPKDNPEIQETIRKCRYDFISFCKIFFPEEVGTEFSVLHHQIIDCIMSNDKNVAVAAPRGIGKTTLTKLYACHNIIYRLSPFILYVTCTADIAIEHSEDIKRLLMSDSVYEVFGDVSATAVTDNKVTRFSKKSWVAFGQTLIMPRGAGQQVRGLNWRHHRPSLIIVDDFESAEHVLSEDQRRKNLKWFYADLMKTESRLDKTQRTLIRVIDTIKHNDSLLNTLLSSQYWKGICLSICDDNLNSLFPEYMTTEQLHRERDEHIQQGIEDLFYAERMNIPIAPKTAMFKTEYFRYYDETVFEIIYGDIKIDKRSLTTFMLIDPARKDTVKSSDAAIIVVSLSAKHGLFFVRYCEAAKIYASEMYNKMFELASLYCCTFIAVETNGLEEYIRQPIMHECELRCTFYAFIWVSTTGNKDHRIGSLEPLYKNGYIIHNRATCTALELQLKWHPASKKKDLSDAMSFLNEVMDKHHEMLGDWDGFHNYPDEGYYDIPTMPTVDDSKWNSI